MIRIETYAYAEDEESQRTYWGLKSWAPETFPPGALLPKLGVIAYDDHGAALCFMCADMSNSVPRAYLDYLHTNPNPNLKAASKFAGVKLAEKFLCEELKRLGYSVIMAMTEKAGIAYLSQKLGYWVNPKGLSYMVKQIT